MRVTKDEKFLIALYEVVKDQFEPDEEEIDAYQVGATIGFTPIATKTLLLQLIRANFARKAGDNLIRLTPTGIKVAKALIESQNP